MIMSIFFCKNDFSSSECYIFYSVRSLRKIERKQEMIKKYSEEKRLEVINARKDGATIAQIAVMTGVGQTTVKAWLKNAGLTARRKWKADEIQAILKEYEECRSRKAIMENTVSAKVRYKKIQPSRAGSLRTKKGRPFSLNSENSPKLKRLQVSEKWSSLRYLAKISLFSAFLKTEKNFLLNRKDFFSGTTANCPDKRC